jgi:hypothetical protein
MGCTKATKSCADVAANHCLSMPNHHPYSNWVLAARVAMHTQQTSKRAVHDKDRNNGKSLKHAKVITLALPKGNKK